MSRGAQPGPWTAAVLALALLPFAVAPDSCAADRARPQTPDPAPPSGLHAAPLALRARPPQGAHWRFTLDGSLPTRQHGELWTGELAIARTTILRLAAFAEDTHESSRVLTRTYVFPQQVLNQDGSGFPATWGVREGQPVAADYAMDPEIVTHPAYAAQMESALRALPTLSLVIDPDDLFGGDRGIYSHPMETGAEWERSATVEWIGDPTVRAGAVGVGVRVQGGWNRRPEESPKHAFRLVFRKRHGPGEWKVPIFGTQAPVEFDELILRAGCNNTWLHWKGAERLRGDYLRDQWMRDSYRAMGRPSARGRFVHLYLNGLYWGLYNVTERPSAPFVAAHFGGRPTHYDVRNGNEPIQGDGAAWDDLMRRVHALSPVTPPDHFAALARDVDLPSLADYLLLNLYGANGDIDGSSNWYAARRREPAGPFHFLVWDGERTLEDPGASTLSEDPEGSPLRIFQRLRAWPEFRNLFGERARRHLTGSGALTPTAAAERYRGWAETLDPAMPAESARWGDYRRDSHRYKEGPYALYTRDEHWRPEVRRLLTVYFPQRTAEVIRQLQAVDLYPAAQ